VPTGGQNGRSQRSSGPFGGATATGETGYMHQLAVAWARLSDCPGLADALLRAEVARSCGTTTGTVRLARLCPRCGSAAHGKPYVLAWDDTVPPHVSISRSDDLAIVAVCRGGPVGIDVERLDAPTFSGFDDVALHPREHAPTVADRAVTWVRKESLLKATGDGLSVHLDGIRLSDPDQAPQLVEWSTSHPPLSSVWMYDVVVGRAHAACVSVLSDEAPRLTVREAAREELPRRASPGTAR
jgi:4'-phosphopantetheinyl transferase